MTTTRYIPVDRRNVFAWLSRGLILPSSAMTKYRSDALQESPHALPLSLSHVAGRLAASAEFPVVVELAPEVRHSSDESEAAPRPVALAQGAISTHRIAKLHVATAGDADEVLARAYRGFDGGQLNLTVTPELFEVAEGDAQWPVEDDSDRPPLDVSLLKRREAVAGAVVSGASPELVSALFKGAETAGGDPDPFSQLVAAARECKLVTSDEDCTFLGGVLRALYDHTESGALVPSGLIEQLSESMSAAGIDGLDAHLQRILQLTRGEDELQPFKRHGGLLTSKALLLYLLRPEPEAVRGWQDEDQNAEPEVLVLSQMLAGLASRYGGLPASQREVPGTDILLDWVARGAQPNDFAVEQEAPLADEPVSETQKVETVQDGNERQALTDEIAEGNSDRAVAVAQTLGWLDCLSLQVVAETFEARTQGRRLRVSFAPGAAIDWELLAEPFMDRLGSLDDAALVLALQGAKPKRKRAARKRTRVASNPDAAE